MYPKPLLFVLLTLFFHPLLTLANNGLEDNISKKRFYELRQITISGNANIFDIKEALRYQHKEELTNLMHSLYAMRSYRPLHQLLDDLWELDKDSAPELAWELISEPPVRLALASTINRIKGNFGGTEFRYYIRQFKYDEDSFVRAQSIIALGLNQNPSDIPYLVEMANGDEHYLIQTSISALAFMGHNNARDALKNLAKKYYGTPRGDLIVDVLNKAYGINTLPAPLEG